MTTETTKNCYNNWSNINNNRNKDNTKTLCICVHVKGLLRSVASENEPSNIKIQLKKQLKQEDSDAEVTGERSVKVLLQHKK